MGNRRPFLAENTQLFAESSHEHQDPVKLEIKMTVPEMLTRANLGYTMKGHVSRQSENSSHHSLKTVIPNLSLISEKLETTEFYVTQRILIEIL
jgi:hypothetical protein